MHRSLFITQLLLSSYSTHGANVNSINVAEDPLQLSDDACQISIQHMLLLFSFFFLITLFTCFHDYGLLECLYLQVQARGWRHHCWSCC